jgi:pimeloyl-ACP methyl ester carboxylesterase
MLSIDLSLISRRSEAELILSHKISSENIRGFILKNLQRTTGNNFIWKIDVSSLLNNLNKIMEGIDPIADVNQHVTGFPVIFLKGKNSDYLPSSDFKVIQKVFPAAEIIEISGAGHWIHADRPDAVIKNIKRLLEDNS